MAPICPEMNEPTPQGDQGAASLTDPTIGNVFERFVTGFSAPFRGVRYLITHKRLLLYALPPVIVTTALISLSWWLGIAYTDVLLEFLWKPEGDAWYTTWLLKPLWWIVYVIMLLFVLTFGTVFSYLASIPIAGPMFELLSEKVEEIETGFAAPFDLVVMARNIVTTAIHVTLFLMLQLLIFGVILLIQLIPVVGQVLGTLLGGLTGPLLVGFVPFDYPTTIRLWKFREKLSFMFRNFALFLGFSLAATLLLYVPLINLVFLPACVVGATLLVLAMEQHGSLPTRDRRKELLNRRASGARAGVMKEILGEADGAQPAAAPEVVETEAG